MMQEMTMTKRQWLTGTAAFAAIALFGTGVLSSAALAQSAPELDRALSKADPGAELVADFNELASASANIATPSEAPDQDKAKAAEIRAALQDPAGIAAARDPTQRAAAQSGAAFQRIPDLAASLDQGIGTRLSADGRAGMVRDFKTVAEYLAITRPNDGWYCAIHGLRVLLPC
jgi:hypothetical protein